MSQDPPDILRRIIARKREEIDERRAQAPIEVLQEQAQAASPVRGFSAAMKQRVADGGTAVIAEIKKASPSKGVMRENFDPVEIARSYEQGGATCLSVLTDRDFFQGHEDYLIAARNACDLPVIRKDFIVDPYQVAEASAIGADCILLIVAALDDETLNHLHDLAVDAGMDVLVEVHDQDELQRALQMNLGMIGINNRDLRTFDTRLDTTLNMLGDIPSDCLVVTESGIHTRDDVTTMRQHDVHAFLVGEAFMRVPDPGTGLKNLFD